MPPRKRTTEEPDTAPETPAERDAQVFRYVHLVATPFGRLDDPGPSNAAVMAAQNAGYRVTGEPTADIDNDVARMQATVTWSVPVEELSS